MGADTVVKAIPSSPALVELAAQWLAVPPDRLAALRTQAEARFQRVINRWLEDEPFTPAISVSFDAEDVVGRPLLVRIDTATQGPTPFLPTLKGNRLITALLVGPREPGTRVTAVATLDSTGTPTLKTLYPGEAVDMLGDEDYAFALAPDGDEVRQLAADLGLEFARRIDALHQAMRSFGLPAANLRHVLGRVDKVGEKFIKILLPDIQPGGAEDKDAGVEVIRNGNIFLSGRRYEPSLSKVVLSDAEIARTGLFRVEVDHETNGVTAYLMTDDGRVAHIMLNPTNPLEPVIEGRLPNSAFEILSKRSETLTLSAVVKDTITEINTNGGSLGLFARLFSGKARQNHSDLALLTAFAQGPGGSAREIEAWSTKAEATRAVAAAALRHLPSDPPDHQGDTLRRALIAIGVGQVLGAHAAAAKGK
jgi:hypothetical protein